MPFRNGKMTGVLNGNGDGTNEMSYVDMHDLHPENVQAAVVNGAVGGAVSGATLAAIPAGVVAFAMSAGEKDAQGFTKHEFTGKTIGIAAAFVAVGAVVMSAVRAFTAQKDAETHNAWSNRVLSRMETHESEQAAIAANGHTGAINAQREEAAQTTTHLG